jgi:NAD+ kinase
MKRIFIAGNADKKGCAKAVDKLKVILTDKAVIVGVDLSRGIQLPDEPIDLIISLGGDGSMLNMVDTVIKKDIPIMGINFGRLGFLTAAIYSELEPIMKAYLSGHTSEFHRSILELNFTSDNGSVSKYALNDVVIASPDLSRVTSLYVLISDEPFFKLRGDGLIISTPTGSTAHSLSAGGSLVDPKLEALLLTPLSPQSLSSRPIIIRPNAKIEVGLQVGDMNPDILCDGQHVGFLKKETKLNITTSKKHLKIVQPKDFRFFKRLSNKLGWAKSFEIN